MIKFGSHTSFKQKREEEPYIDTSVKTDMSKRRLHAFHNNLVSNKIRRAAKKMEQDWNQFSDVYGI